MFTAAGLVLLLAAVATGLALLLRWARCPGWVMAGGLLAGVFLGPAVLGRIIPDAYEHTVIGGVAEREALHRLYRARAATTAAAEEAVGDAAATLDQVDDQITEAEAVLGRARRYEQRHLRHVAFAIVALVLLAGGAPRHRAPPGGSWTVAATSIGGWAAALPGAAAYALGRWWEFDHGVCLLVGAALAIGPWRLSADDAAIADQAEVGGGHLVTWSGRIASVIAGLAAAWILGPVEPAAALMLLTLPIGWCLGPDRWPGIANGLRVVLVATLTAAALIPVDVIASTSLWPIAFLVVLSGDGRWIGATIGAILPGGRGGLRSMRMLLGLMAAGPTQVSIAALGSWTGLMPGSLVLALVLGGVTTEMTAGLRRRMAAELAVAEAEIDDLRRDGEGGG